MNGWLIYNKEDAEQNTSYIKWFIEEANIQNIDLLFMLREDLTIGIIAGERTILYDNKVIELPDFAVVRTIEPLLNLQLESLGVDVYNSYDIATLCGNKALTHYYINRLDIPMTDTIFVTKHSLLAGPPLMPFPLIVKETGGRGGQQVYNIQDEDSWNQRITTLEHSEFIVQSTHNVQSGKDVRVFVVGKEIIGAVLRENAHDFRSNYKLGGTASWYSLSPSEIKNVQTIIDHFDFGMVGIDFLLDHNGYFLFNEIEDVVGSRTLSIVSDINILRRYITHIRKLGLRQV